MSKFTKQAIMDGFIELSKQMPIDKITVKKVTDYIGITRNTFYYHYQDILSLIHISEPTDVEESRMPSSA